MSGRLLAGALVLAVGLVACGTTEATKPGMPQPWAERASAWFGNYDAALDAGTGQHALFLAPDVVIDSAVLPEHRHAVGRPRALGVQREVYQGPVERGGLFVDASGVVRAESWTGAAGAVDVLVWMAIGSDGISRFRYAVPLLDALDVDQAGVARLVRSHQEAWRGGSGGPDNLYGPDARLTDSIRGIDVAGVAAIADVATTGVQDDDADTPLSAPAARSTYIHRSGGDGALEVWALQPGAGPCNSDTMVALVLDSGGLIITERRYHALDALAACTGLREPDNGWWVGCDAPEAFGDRVTGTIHGPSGSVQMRNGGPAWDRVVSWSLDRFTQARLPAPDVSVVAFDPFDPRCIGRCGLASSTPPASVLICLDAAGLNQVSSGHLTDAVPLWPTRLVLHELAHVWIDQHVEAPARHRLMEHYGLASWDDLSSTWEQRGKEWAAETIVWGLIDQVCTLTALGAPHCDQLAEAFYTLTGVQPLTACDQARAG